MSEAAEISIKTDLPETTYYSGILYHGANTPFEFKTTYDYEKDAIGTDGSWTLGPGIYLLNNEDGAKQYSQVRQGSRYEAPYVYTAYAPDCKFLDFRGEDGENVAVPKNIVHQWSEYFSKHLEEEIQAKPDIGPARENIVDANGRQRIKINRAYEEREDKKRYRQFLKELEEKQNVNLRVMFGTAPAGETKSGFSGGLIGPEWGNVFRKFVTEELGYDGIIYIEGSEAKDEKDNATFIVYDLDSLKFSINPQKSTNRL